MTCTAGTSPPFAVFCSLEPSPQALPTPQGRVWAWGGRGFAATLAAASYSYTVGVLGAFIP